MIQRILLLIVSIVSLYVAPVQYNYSFNLFIFILFCYNGWLTMKEDLKTQKYISFSILFFLSFFLVSFVYPIFLYPAGLNIWYDRAIDPNYINKASVVCNIGFASYAMGQSIANNIRLKKSNNKVIPNKYSPLIWLIFPLLALIFLFLGFLRIEEGSNNYTAGYNSLIYQVLIFYVSITIVLAGRNSVLFRRKWPLILVILLSSFTLITSIGERGLVIYVLILLAALYNDFIKKINLVYGISGVVISVVLLYYIGQIRSEVDIINGISQIKVSEINSNWTYFSDLTGIFRNACVGYEYVENHGFYIPERIFILLLTPIPFFPTLFSSLLGVNFNMTSSCGNILTLYTGEKLSLNFSGGIGTHCVIDAYMSWGIVGVVVLFVLFGYIVYWAKNKMKYNHHYVYIYYTYVAYALYIPRSTVFESYRIIIYVFLLSLLFSHLTFSKTNS